MARAGLSVEKLCRAGAELADEVGFEKITVSAVAQRVGVAAPSLYSHLRSSRELMVGVARLALSELADRVAAALVGRAGVDALGAFADSYRDYAREHPGRFAATQFRFDADEAAQSDGARHTELARAVLRGYECRTPTTRTRCGSWAAS